MTNLPSYPFRSALLAFALAAVSHVTTATASGQDLEPDTLDWRSYFPLAVGNQWQYTYNDGLNDVVRVEKITSTVLIDTEEFFEFHGIGIIDADTVTHQIEYIRYSTDNGNLSQVVLDPNSGDVVAELPWGVCPLDAMMGPRRPEACSGIAEGSTNNVRGEYQAAIQIGKDTVTVAGLKVFDDAGFYSAWASGIGVVGFAGDFVEPGILEYAHVGGVAYGTPVVSTTVEKHTARDGRFEVFPNPASHVVQVVAPANFRQPYSVSLFSIDGRLLRRPIADSDSPITLDIAPSGLILVVVEWNGGRQVSKIIRQK
ncbi:MAG: T9SS type A sorting domain-containing protein [Rhodothermales bacterium]